MNNDKEADWYAEVARQLFEQRHEYHDLDWDPSYWPRKPDEYTPTDHFMNKMKEDRRHIEGEYIRRCIEEGEILPSHGTRAIFHKNFSGVSFYMVVGSPLNGNSYFEVMTMYPWVKSRGDAIMSGKWNIKEVEEIRQFNDELMERGNRAAYIHRNVNHDDYY